jgi:hypothetical protein
LAVDVHPDDKEKTAFSTGHGLWQFTVMPFSFCNTLATFAGLMETVLRGLTYDSCLVYVDYMIIIGRTFQEHLLNLWKVFQRFREVHNTQSGEVSTLAEGSMTPQAYFVT